MTIHDVGEDHGRFFVVTELIEGETLRERLRRGPMPPREAIECAIAITSALAAAHARGVVHRDLKPENVMMTRTGKVKVLDFGVAKIVASADAGDGAASDGADRTGRGGRDARVHGARAA